MDELYDLYKKLHSLNWFCSDCDAVAYGHYNPCFDCSTHKEREKIMKEIDSIKRKE